MALVKSLALVLRSRPYRETSLMFSAITPAHGTLHFLGKGFREKHHGFMAPFDSLTLLELVFYERTRSGLQLLKEADEVERFPHIKKDLLTYAYAAYFSETVGQLVLEGDQELAIFSLLLEAFAQMGRCDLEHLAPVFQVRLLALAGFLPQLYSCVQCGKSDLPSVRFDYEQGGVVCEPCAPFIRSRLPLSAGTLEALRYMARESFEDGLRLRAGRQSMAELKGILRRFIAYRLEGTLRSAGVLRQIEKFR